jgi:hypothetical protein
MDTPPMRWAGSVTVHDRTDLATARPPHLQDGFKLSTDPLFVEKIVDVIVGLYDNPQEKAVVLGWH